MEEKDRYFIGIAGGTCAGKTSVARGIEERIEDYTSIIVQDNYYEDQSDMELEERKKQNYDHPDAFDWDLMEGQIEKMLEGECVDMPVYDFERHTRKDYTERFCPNDTIILEGILALYDERIRDMMDLKLYVDTDDDLRVMRRIERDIQERGRDLESVLKQFRETVKPMHEEFIQPTKKHADIIIPRGYNEKALDMVVTSIQKNSPSYRGE